MNITKAAAAYWALIFALGFVLGTVRTLWGADALGEGNFILIEIPVMLSASWLAARRLVARYEVPRGLPALAMGGIAFALLMLAEAALTAMLGGDPMDWLASLAASPALYGFAGQIAFGLMPWIVARSGGRP